LALHAPEIAVAGARHREPAAVLQGEKFDPDSAYVRRWVPEPAPLPQPLIQRSWSAAPLEPRGAGVELGRSYPKPIVDHKPARERALVAYARLRKA
jgi:deoxyribodipyrimidine photo-lyase